MVPCLQPRRALGARLVIAERDKLAEEITREYLPIVDKLVDLVTRLVANDKQREVCTDMPVRQVRRSFARAADPACPP